jgi:DNA polymerase III subunit delta
MQITPQQLQKGLNPSAQALCLICGNITAMVDLCKQALWQQAQNSGFAQRTRITIHKVDDIDNLQQILNTPSLFGDNTWIDCTVESTKLGVKGYQRLQACCDAMQSQHSLCLHLPHMDATKKKQKWFLKLSQSATCIDCKEPSLGELKQWIKFACQDNKLKLSQEQTSMLITYTEGNLSACLQEIIKLSLIANGKALDNDTMQAALSHCAQHTLFQLIDQVLAGNIDKSCQMLTQLRNQDTAPVLILWGLVRELRSLIDIKVALLRKTPFTKVMQQHRVWSSRQAAVKRAIDQHSIQSLLSMLQQSAHLEKSIKGLGSGHIWAQCNTLFLQLAGCTSPFTAKTS